MGCKFQWPSTEIFKTTDYDVGLTEIQVLMKNGARYHKSFEGRLEKPFMMGATYVYNTTSNTLARNFLDNSVLYFGKIAVLRSDVDIIEIETSELIRQHTHATSCWRWPIKWE